MNIEEKIIEIVRQNLAQDKRFALITPQTNLLEELGIDSFATLMIANDIEDEFDISISREMIAGTKNVAEIAEKLKSNFPEIG